MRLIAIPLSLLALSGCASIVSGSSQVVSVSTTPPGATCEVARRGAPLGVINATPGMVHIGKSAADLNVTCTKPGYETATAATPSSFNGWTFGNLILGGAIGIVVDVATGADFDYPPLVQVSMKAKPDPTQAPVADAAPGTPRVVRAAVTTEEGGAQPIVLPASSPIFQRP